jgi:hypothetical protein
MQFSQLVYFNSKSSKTRSQKVPFTLAQEFPLSGNAGQIPNCPTFFPPS